MAQRSITNQYDMLIIGGSAGSLDVLLKLLPALKDHLHLAVVIIVHRKNTDSLLAGLLADKTQLPVKEAEEKETISKGTVYIAPADYHLLIEKDKTFSLDYSERIHHSRPAIDVSFETAADAYGPKLIALLLSGANADGAEGLAAIKRAGGITIVQDPQEAAVSYMPEQAIQASEVDYVADTETIIEIINRFSP
jgi:two-component system, chemotaxis family, protein-glutamate methylesterase/glutaminase